PEALTLLALADVAALLAALGDRLAGARRRPHRVLGLDLPGALVVGHHCAPRWRRDSSSMASRNRATCRNSNAAWGRSASLAPANAACR
ncbi:MAG: hypothetical protein ACK559_04125, partial [bacterium]